MNRYLIEYDRSSLSPSALALRGKIEIEAESMSVLRGHLYLYNSDETVAIFSPGVNWAVRRIDVSPTWEEEGRGCMSVLEKFTEATSTACLGCAHYSAHTVCSFPLKVCWKRAITGTKFSVNDIWWLVKGWMDK